MATTRGPHESNEIENQEWLDSLDYVQERAGAERVRELISLLQIRAQQHGVQSQYPGNTPYINTIPLDQQPPFPGNQTILGMAQGTFPAQLRNCCITYPYEI